MTLKPIRGPFNNPRISGNQPIIVVADRNTDLSQLLGTRSSRSTEERCKHRRNQCAECGYVFVGYQRFASCNMDCKKQFKVYICYKGSSDSCNGSESTHTHLQCECQKLNFIGAVQVLTRKDREIVQRTPPDVSTVSE